MFDITKTEPLTSLVNIVSVTISVTIRKWFKTKYKEEGFVVF